MSSSEKQAVINALHWAISASERRYEIPFGKTETLAATKRRREIMRRGR